MIQAANTYFRNNVEVLGAVAKLKKLLLGLSCMSVRMEQLGSHWEDCTISMMFFYRSGTFMFR
jgi:hypothetical protein